MAPSTTSRSFLLSLTMVTVVCLCNGQFTNDQKTELLKKHNDARRVEKASDMNELVWDDQLTSEGQKLAETCKDGHVKVTIIGITHVGQNLYYVTSPTAPPVDAFDAWHGEYRFYNKATNTCKPDSVCGHYRMVVLNSVSKLGCGFKVCSSFEKEDGSKISGVTFVVCHYDDAPLGSGPVFTVGTPCTKCPARKFWCNNELCQPTCTAASDKCECYAKYDGVCKNCATFNADCTCKCGDGYLGTYCTETCEDLPTGTNIQTSCTVDVTEDPEGYCTMGTDGKCCPYIWERTCRATCARLSNFCTPLTSALKTAATTGCSQKKPTAPGSTTDATTVPPKDPCTGYKCFNGKKEVVGTSCRCNCFEKWAGAACDVQVVSSGERVHPHMLCVGLLVIAVVPNHIPM